MEATRSDLTAARGAAELATQRTDSVTRERDELHIQLEELNAALVSRFGVTEAERLVSSSQRLNYQAPSGSSEVTGRGSSAEGGIARSRIELITPGLIRTHSGDSMRITPWPFGVPLLNSSDENLVRGLPTCSTKRYSIFRRSIYTLRILLLRQFMSLRGIVILWFAMVSSHWVYPHRSGGTRCHHDGVRYL